MSVTPNWPTAGAPTTGPIPSDNLISLTSYYVSRLIFQYATKPNAQRLIALMVKQALMDDLATQVLEGFDVDTAVGAQLDILGKYIGVSRNVGTAILPGLFSFWTYASSLDPTLYQGTWDPASDTPVIPAASGGNTGWWYVASAAGISTSPISETFKCGDIIVSNGSAWSQDTTDCGNGLTSYVDLAANVNAVFYGYGYASQQVNSLSDPSYRVLLKLKSILNINDGTLYSINNLLNQLFPDQITVTDNQDMTLSYVVAPNLPLTVSVWQSYLPRPMGVGISVTVAPYTIDRATTDGSLRVTSSGAQRVAITSS